MSFLARFWRGQFSLARTFWLGWAIPIVGGNLAVSFAAWWLINNFGLVIFYAFVVFVVGYGIGVVVPVWRSATVYNGSKVLKHAARLVATVASATQIITVGVIVYTLASLKFGFAPTHDADRTAEKMAVPSESHPLAGFWKSSPTDNFGLAIAPAEGKLYSVSFCGPGGCFKPGTYRPNTPLIGDKDYQVTSTDTLLVYGQDGWSTYQRAVSRGEENCPPK